MHSNLQSSFLNLDFPGGLFFAPLLLGARTCLAPYQCLPWQPSSASEPSARSTSYSPSPGFVNGARRQSYASSALTLPSTRAARRCHRAQQVRDGAEWCTLSLGAVAVSSFHLYPHTGLFHASAHMHLPRHSHPTHSTHSRTPRPTPPRHTTTPKSSSPTTCTPSWTPCS